MAKPPRLRRLWRNPSCLDQRRPPCYPTGLECRVDVRRPVDRSVSPCLVFFGHTDRVGDSLGHGAAVIPVLVPFPTNEQCLGARCRKLDEPWRPLGSPKWISNPCTAKSLIMNIEKNGTKRTCPSHKPGREKKSLDACCSWGTRRRVLFPLAVLHWP